MKEQNGKKRSKKLEEPTRKPCKYCRFYDWTTERQFHRKVGPKNEKGERTLIVEPRAICRGSKATAKGHLVHRDQTKRPCSQFEVGKYKPPKEEEKKKESDEEKTSPEEYFGTPEGRLKEQKKKPKELEQLEKLIEKSKTKSKTSAETNILNCETKTLTVKRGKIIVK